MKIYKIIVSQLKHQSEHQIYEILKMRIGFLYKQKDKYFNLQIFFDTQNKYRYDKPRDNVFIILINIVLTKNYMLLQ